MRIISEKEQSFSVTVLRPSCAVMPFSLPLVFSMSLCVCVFVCESITPPYLTGASGIPALLPHTPGIITPLLIIWQSTGSFKIWGSSFGLCLSVEPVVVVSHPHAVSLFTCCRACLLFTPRPFCRGFCVKAGVENQYGGHVENRGLDYLTNPLPAAVCLRDGGFVPSKRLCN